MVVPDYLVRQTRKIVSLIALVKRAPGFTVIAKLTTPLETLASGVSPSGIAFSDSWPFLMISSCAWLLGNAI